MVQQCGAARRINFPACYSIVADPMYYHNKQDNVVFFPIKINIKFLHVNVVANVMQPRTQGSISTPVALTLGTRLNVMLIQKGRVRTWRLLILYKAWKCFTKRLTPIYHPHKGLLPFDNFKLQIP